MKTRVGWITDITHLEKERMEKDLPVTVNLNTTRIVFFNREERLRIKHEGNWRFNPIKRSKIMLRLIVSVMTCFILFCSGKGFV